MAGQFKGSIYYFLIQLKRPFIIFWSIIISFMVLGYGMSLLFGAEDTFVMFDMSFPIYVFGAVFGFVAVKNCIPYLVRMGATRSIIFTTVGISLFLLAVVNAVIANTLYTLSETVFGEPTKGMVTIEVESGEASYAFSHLADLVNNTWYTRVVIDTSIGFFLLALLFVLALMFYRYGFIGGFGILGLTMAVVVLGISREWFTDFFIFIANHFSFTFFYQLFVTGIIIYLIAYLLMRRLTI